MSNHKEVDDMLLGSDIMSVFENDANVSMVQALSVIQTPTNPNWVKERKSGRDSLSYVSGDTVTRMLNKAFSYKWSFHVLETRVIHSVDKNPTKWELDKNPSAESTPQNPVVQALGRLVVPGFGIREQWGSQPLQGGADVQEHAFKSAATDAMKKCASMFGIALDLYGTDGMHELMVGPDDLLANDAEILSRIKAQKEQADLSRQGAQETTAETPVEQPQAQTPEQAPVQSELTQTQEEQAPSSESLGEKIVAFAEEQAQQASAPQQTTQEPAQPIVEPAQATQASPSRWEKQDIDGLKNQKERLGILVNDGLNPLTVEFFGSPDATYQMITPTNVKDFLMFLSTKQPQQ